MSIHEDNGMDYAPLPPRADNSLLHFACYDRKGRDGHPDSLYDIWLAPEHIAVVRAGFMADPEATDDERALKNLNHAARALRAPPAPVRVFVPDRTRTTIILVSGEKFMVKGPPQVHAARVNAARNGLAYEGES